MGLYKRQRTWWMRFDHHGRTVRRTTGTTDRRLAEAIFAKVRIKLAEGRYFDTLQEQERTVAELMARYLTERSAFKAPKSNLRDQQALKHLLPVMGDKRLGEVSPKVLAAYKTQRRREGAAPATINKELQVVRHAYNLAEREWEWCRDNPMRKVTMEAVHNQVDRWLTEQEETRLLAAA